VRHPFLVRLLSASLASFPGSPVALTLTAQSSSAVGTTAPQTPIGPPAPPPNVIRLTSARQADEWMVWEIPSARAAVLPRWTEDVSALGLSSAEAVRIGGASAKSQHPDLQRLELQSVIWTRIHRGADVDFGFYEIDYFGYGGPPRSSGPLIRTIVLPDGAVVEPTPAPSASPVTARIGSSPPVAPGASTTMPKLTHLVKAEYSEEAMKRRITGEVLVQGVVGVDGVIRDLRITRSLDPVFGLDQQALKAVAQYQFEPGTKTGTPVPVTVTVEVTFNMKH
jgi:TonB family protein